VPSRPSAPAILLFSIPIARKRLDHVYLRYCKDVILQAELVEKAAGFMKLIRLIQSLSSNKFEILLHGRG
jgi:hypothetical protein